MRRAFSQILLVLLLALPESARAVPWAYITDYGDDTVSVLDTATNTIVAVLPVNPSPFGVTLSPTGTRVYITHDNAGGTSVIDTATNSVIGTITAGSRGIAVTPDGSRLYIPNTLTATVSVVDTSNNQPIGSPIAVGDQPTGVAVTPDGSRVYVANAGTSPGTVSVIDTSNDTVIDTIDVGEGAFGVVVTPDGLKVYVTNSLDSDPGTVSVISTLTNTVLTTIDVGQEPQGIAVSPNGLRVYVANTDLDALDDPDTVSVIDTSSDTVTATIPVDYEPLGISVTPDGSRVYVANSAGTAVGDDNTMSVIKTADNTVITTFGGLASPYAFGQFIGAACPATPFACDDTGAIAPDHKTLSCENHVTTLMGTTLRKIMKCHSTNAIKEFRIVDYDEDSCDTAATDFLDTRVENLPDCPDCIDSTAVGDAVRTLLDDFNGQIFCDGATAFASGDAGVIPSGTDVAHCERGVAAVLGTYAVRIISCHKRFAIALFNGDTFDESACKAAALELYENSSAGLENSGTCPPCLVAATRTALANQIRAQMDSFNVLTYCAQCLDDTQCTTPATCGGGGVSNICGIP